MLTKEQTKSAVAEGTLRLMTTGEISMASEIFRGNIVYPRVWVHCDSYLPGGLQGKYVGMSPNGEIYFRKELYQTDFSAAHVSLVNKHTFIHELAHVWQHQRGMWVRTRGFFSWAANYTYELDKNRTLKDYSLEQQAQIIADYWLLMNRGKGEWDFQRVPGRLVTYRGKVAGQPVTSLYQSVLSKFFKGT